MINLNEIDVNELVLKLSSALFEITTGKYYDIKVQTGCSDEEADEIIEAYKIASEIAFEKKFIPLNLDFPKVLSNTPDNWFRNYGQEPMFEGRLVDVMFYGGREEHTYPSNYWDWSIRTRDISSVIKFWRYSKV